MTSFALLSNVDHQDVRIITERSAEYGDDVMHVMTFPFEFRDVQTFYPILLYRDEDGNFYPLALFGFQAKENLFLDDSGWHARYVPAMIRRQPFLIGYQESADQGEEGPKRMLSVDMDHPRVSTEEGEVLFQPLGGRTPFLEDAAALMETIYHGYEQNKKFVGALQEHKLIESVTFDIALDDGSRNQLLGFFAVNEEKLQELPGETLKEFSENGFLMPIFMMLASLSNLRTLVEMKNQRLAGE